MTSRASGRTTATTTTATPGRKSATASAFEAGQHFSMSAFWGYWVTVVGEQWEGQGRDEGSVAGAHAGDPLVVRAQLDGAGLEAVGVARDGVADAELYLALARQGKLGGDSHQPQDALEALAGVGHEVLIADAEVLLRGAAPEGFGGGVPGVPEGGALGGAEAGHVLTSVGVRLGLLLQPGVGGGPGVPDQVQHVEVHIGDHAHSVSMRRFLGGVHDHPAIRDGAYGLVEPSVVDQEFLQPLREALPAPFGEHQGDVPGAGARRLEPHHLAGIHPVHAAEGLVHDPRPDRALAEGPPAAAEAVLEDVMPPDEVQLARREVAPDLA